jgi:hypothetical protein
MLLFFVIGLLKTALAHNPVPSLFSTMPPLPIVPFASVVPNVVLHSQISTPPSVTIDFVATLTPKIVAGIEVSLSLTVVVLVETAM